MLSSLRVRTRARLKPSLKIGRLKLSSTLTTNDLSDVLYTSLDALRESSDAFPPLKSAVGGVMALWEMAKRAKHSKADARGLALGAQEILDVLVDAVPDDPSTITPAMLFSIQRFIDVLDDSTRAVESIALAGSFSRAMRHKRNEETLQDIKRRLNEAQAERSTC
ncbi:hypothetical protein C8R46DRAFT_605174 [Mycena filopes]|nr:hypothetical protein C8R46DRAFT_605174 [Mycena filopes]